jgi:hypothetical protein
MVNKTGAAEQALAMFRSAHQEETKRKRNSSKGK